MSNNKDKESPIVLVVFAIALTLQVTYWILGIDFEKDVSWLQGTLRGETVIGIIYFVSKRL